MNALTHLLREADPLRYDNTSFSTRAPELRRRVIAAAESVRPVAVERAPLWRAATVAVGVVVLLVGLWYGSFRWFTPAMAQVRFEVRLAEEHPVQGLLVARIGGTDRLIYLHPEIVVSNADIARAWVVDAGASQAGVSVQLFPEGAERLRQATGAHVGRPVALLVDGQVVTTPIVRSPIADSATLTGGYTRAEAERLAAGMVPR